MQKQWISRKPRYFFTVFGWGKKPLVEGGRYPHRKGHISNKNVGLGDVVLPYCGADYPEPAYCQTAPGIGVVVGTEIGEEKEVVCYQYFPFYQPVPFGILRQNIPEIEEHRPLNFIGNWFFEIKDATSFRRVLGGTQINWP
jgi:hypothetical protein